jgi:Zn-dependent protease with chaperone function
MRAVAAAVLALAAATVSVAQDEARELPAGFAPRLTAAVTARLRLTPVADGVLQEAADRCASRIAPVRPAAFREAAPRILALPDGTLLVSTGLLASCRSDAELVSALAHEAGHLRRGDLADRLLKAYGAPRLARIAAGQDADALAGMAANVASGGLLTRHGSQSEQGAEDAAVQAGCGGGLAAVLERSERQGRPKRRARWSHPVAPATEASFAASADPVVELLQRLDPILPLP